jgi:hypothetical protein
LVESYLCAGRRSFLPVRSCRMKSPDQRTNPTCPAGLDREFLLLFALFLRLFSPGTGQSFQFSFPLHFVYFLLIHFVIPFFKLFFYFFHKDKKKKTIPPPYPSPRRGRECIGNSACSACKGACQNQPFGKTSCFQFI